MASPSILDDLAAWPGSGPGQAKFDAGRESWLAAVRRRRAAGRARRVLFCHSQLPGETGSGVYLQEIVAGATRRGIEMHVLCAAYGAPDAGAFAGVPAGRIHVCRFTPPGANAAHADISFEIPGMSVVMPYPNRPFRDLTGAQLQDYATVWSGKIRERVADLQPDIIHVDHLWFLTGFARLAAPWIPVCVSAHGTANKLLLDAPRFEQWVLPAVRTADHVCAISPESVIECTTRFGIARDRISIEGYGFNAGRFCYSPVDRRTVLRGLGVTFPETVKHLVLFIGKFVAWKGIEELIRGVAALRERHGDTLALLVVGEGTPESRRHLEALTADLGLEHLVKLPGKFPREGLPDVYRAADVFVLPSYSEPWGLVLMEALACGTPAVAAHTGGPPYYVPGESVEAGLVEFIDPVAVDDAGEPRPKDRSPYARRLAGGIDRILRREHGEAERRRLSESMRHLSWEGLVERLSGIYDRILEAALF